MIPKEHEIHRGIVLSDRDRDAFLAALESPPEPNEALRRAARSWREARKSGELKSEPDMNWIGGKRRTS